MGRPGGRSPKFHGGLRLGGSSPKISRRRRITSGFSNKFSNSCTFTFFLPFPGTVGENIAFIVSFFSLFFQGFVPLFFPKKKKRAAGIPAARLYPQSSKSNRSWFRSLKILKMVIKSSSLSTLTKQSFSSSPSSCLRITT